ncbi:MAG TPA: hypothetical protein VHZ03_14245 [Trebonia sp.]|jgi:hypothetical protein|nr:hypothetical protein [Trebonia sp.]
MTEPDKADDFIADRHADLDAGEFGGAMTDADAATTGHGYAYCCEVCDDADPRWRIERWGDAVVTWACDTDLPEICGRLQRDREVTKLSVTDSRKARERAETARLARGEDERHQAEPGRYACCGLRIRP